MLGDKDRWVIWPAYLDSALSRGQGRMVAKEDAVLQVKVEDIVRAAISLGLDPEVERDKRFSGQWYERPGMVLVAKKGPKSAILKSVARTIKKTQR